MNIKPIRESYWVIPRRFLAGAYPGLRYDMEGTRKRLTAFLDAGFDTFIDLTSEGEYPDYLPILQEEAKAYERLIHHQRFSFPDFAVPAPEMMIAALDAIDTGLAEGRHIYLHCVGGIGRTGTTVGCWLVRHGMKPKEALLHLGKLYYSAEQSTFMSHSPETEEQARFILNWTENGLA